MIIIKMRKTEEKEIEIEEEEVTEVWSLGWIH